MKITTRCGHAAICDLNEACTRYTGIDGARTWCGHGIFNHNLIKIATLADTN